MISLAKILGGNTVNSILGGAPVAQIAEVGFKHILKVRQDRIQNRILDFHDRILRNNLSEDEKRKVLEGEISEEDYYTLLGCVTQDEEEEKVEIYAKIFKRTVIEKFPELLKRIIIKQARDLSMYDIKLMRKIYMLGEFDKFTGNEKINDLLVNKFENNILVEYSVKNLLKLGFIEPKGDKDTYSTKQAKTEYLSSFVCQVFDYDEIRIDPIGEHSRWDLKVD